ncbi:hypothetical protein AB0L75_07790 [Streptomyces sp. NPDC052101]|uniref:hypothetical protein n=1 Tax=Streptomyces sp. NPDC052101 TaxID=3155763 RepID=UPI0034322A0F
MIRIVTQNRIERLERDARAACEHARQTSGAANEAFGEHVRELYVVTDRAERAEANTCEVGVMLLRAMEELSASQQELLLKDIEIRRLREELLQARRPAAAVFVLLHYGEVRMVYRSREDAYADTATHGVPADRTWGPAQRFWADAEWVLATFTYDPASRGFRSGLTPVAEPVGGAA